MSRSWILLLLALPAAAAACRPAGARATTRPRGGGGGELGGDRLERALRAVRRDRSADRRPGGPSHAHFTYLPDFSALNEGSVTGILRGPDGREESFLAPKPLAGRDLQRRLQARARGDVRPDLPGPEPARRARTSPPAGCASGPRRPPAASPSRLRTLRTKRPRPASRSASSRSSSGGRSSPRSGPARARLKQGAARLRQGASPRPAARRS